MANLLYPLFKQAQLDSTSIDFNTDDIIAVLVANTYSYSATHDFLDDLGANALALSDPLTTPTITNGVFDSDNVTFPTVAGGDTIGYIALVQYTGVNSTSRLIALYDTAVNLPLATNGSDINVSVNPSGWFSL